MKTETRLSDPWKAALEALVAREKADRPSCDEHGTWHVLLGCLSAPPGRILDLLPGDFEQLHEHWEEMIDGSGEGVDYEREDGVYVCAAEHAVFRFSDHWQAGLCGEILLFPDEASYGRYLEDLREDLSRDA